MVCGVVWGGGVVRWWWSYRMVAWSYTAPTSMTMSHLASSSRLRVRTIVLPAHCGIICSVRSQWSAVGSG